MDTRPRNNLIGWFGEVGFLYVLVAVFVGLFFLLREGGTLISCNLTLGERITASPGHYGRNP